MKQNIELHTNIQALSIIFANLVENIALLARSLAHSPKFIEETVTMAKSAGQQAMKILCEKEMIISAAKAKVDPEKCSACLLCVCVCSYGAPFINEDGVSQIPPSACMGCGICVSECPLRAITLKHCTDDQILAKIDAMLEPTDSSFPFPGNAG